MSFTISVKSSINVDGDISGQVSSGSSEVQSDQLLQSYPDETVDAVSSGTLSTRTSETEGVLTVTGHDFDSSDVIAVFWEGGIRYDVEISAVDTDTITFSGGSGDDLPDAATEVTVSKSIAIDAALDCDNLTVLAAGGNTAQLYSFINSAGSSAYASEPGANQKTLWWNGMATNPLAGVTLVSVNVYNKSTSTEASACLWLGYNN